MKRKGRKQVVINKEEIADSWCFVCKDGGEIRICDDEQCLKSYHPCCVGEDDTFLERNDRWTCPWHTCSLCSRPSYLYCYTCPNAFCRHCLPDADILQIKGKNGFCNTCLKLALLIEENKDYDSDSGKLDFTNWNTYEALYKEYYKIIKATEGFQLTDLYAAKNRVKVERSHLSGSDIEESDEEQVSDYDDVEYERESMKTHRTKRSGKQKSAVRTPLKSKKQEFIGWASISLIEFLNSVGKCTDGRLSQHEVYSIITKYVEENKLFDSEKRKMINCDDRLQPLFKRKQVNKSKVYNLLGAHFAENHDDSEEDELAYDTEDDDAGIQDACKRQRKLDEESRSQKKQLKRDVPLSCYAAVVVENVKLIYLKRSLLRELLKQPESFDEKVFGCFVRVKSDPNDYLAKNCHQLRQVKGVKTVSTGENKKDTFLLFSAFPKEINMNLLSDDDFSEEECKDLREKMLAGEVERPTVGDLQQKAKILHEDLTKHAISRELSLLKNLIDRANEKGWRRELFNYRERQKILQNPLELSRLLAEVPTVIPDINELDSNNDEIENDTGSDKGSPRSILQCDDDSSVPRDGLQDQKASEEKTQHDHTSHKVINQPLSVELEHDNITCRGPSQLTAEMETSKLEAEESLTYSREIHCKKETKEGDNATKIEVIELLSDDESANEDNKPNYVLASEKKGDGDLKNEIWHYRGPNGERDMFSFSVMKKWSEKCSYASQFKVWKEDEEEENAIWLLDAVRLAF